MEDALKSEVTALAEEADTLMDEVEAALEEHAPFAQRRKTRGKVDDLERRFRELTTSLGEDDRAWVQRHVGRKIAEVLKVAGKLPAALVGRPAEKRVDTGFFETRPAYSSRGPVDRSSDKREKRLSVTHEIDAWCGRCFMVRMSVIAAMVGDQPAQVVCSVCGNRSRYRTSPARGGKDDEPAETPRATSTPVTTPTDQRNKDRNELIETLRAADSVRTFSPKERYKTGEVIEHPEHGRGKIENVLPRSLLVRFPSGIKPLKLA